MSRREAVSRLFRRTLRSRRRFIRLVALSAAVGIATGAAVAVVDLALRHGWDAVSEHAPTWLFLVLPVAGLVAATAAVRYGTPDRSGETAEEYIRAFHDPMGRIRPLQVPGRLLAAAATVLGGGSVGLEGPSLFLGGFVGDWTEHRLARWLGFDRPHILLVAGGAAGIAAIFKAPVTGLIFALEVPYADDMARNALVPALVGSASGYLTFVSFPGIDVAPLFPVGGLPTGYRLSVLFASLALGLLCGLAARLFVALLHTTQRIMFRVPRFRRAVFAGVGLGVIGVVAHLIYGSPLALGPGYEAINRAATGGLGPGKLSILLGLKLLATVLTFSGGGVGGVFIPLVVMGALTGTIFTDVGPAAGTSLYAVLGVSAFLGAGYHTPLAAVAFVAETTGTPGYIVPALLAGAAAYLIAGPRSVSHRQRAQRASALSARLEMPAGTVMTREIESIGLAAPLSEAFRVVVRSRLRMLPVCDDGGLLVGVISVDDLAAVAQEEWSTTAVADAMRPRPPVAAPDWPLSEVGRAMEENGLDVMLVVAPHAPDRVLGAITAGDIVALHEILGTVEGT